MSIRNDIFHILDCKGQVYNTEQAIDKMIQLFLNYNRYSVSYISTKDTNEVVEIFAKSKEDCLKEVGRIDPLAKYIFISKI